MQLIYDLVDTQELNGFVRGIQQEEERNRFVLQNYLPNDFIDEMEYRVPRGQHQDQDAAPVRAWDTEAPIGTRQGFARLMGELPPVSKKIPVTEEERLRRRALERGNNQALEDAVYDDAANLTRSVLARVEMFRGEALHSGQIVINENGVRQAIPFGRKASHSVAPATLWSTTAAADPVRDIMAWVAVYITTNGVAPAFILTSTEVVANLLLNASIRALAGTVAGAPGIVTVDTLQSILRAFGLPPIVTYDVMVRVNKVATRVIPANKVILMPPANEPLGATLWGTTAEALVLTGAQEIAVDQAPGLVAVTMASYDPVHTWTKVASVPLPVLPNPDLTLTATVQ